MQAHEQRMREESQELAGRLSRLMAFTATEIFRNLGEQDKQLMREQAVVMKDYLNILNIRIDLLPKDPS